MTLTTHETASVDATWLSRWRTAVAGRRPRIALPDAEDERVLSAAAALHADGLARPRLFGDANRIARTAAAAGVRLPEDAIVDLTWALADELTRDALEQGFSGDPKQFPAALSDPICVAAAALRAGRVNGCVAGATRPTEHVVRAGLRIVGREAGIGALNRCFHLILDDGRFLTLAEHTDAPGPDAEGLAELAIAAAATHHRLTGEAPVVALLPSSDARGDTTDSRVETATRRVRERGGPARVRGAPRFDVTVASTTPVSVLAETANVLVSSDAGRGTPVERPGSAVVLGPTLQGLSAPLNVLSPRCTASDIEMTALLTAVQPNR